MVAAGRSCSPSGRRQPDADEVLVGVELEASQADLGGDAGAVAVELNGGKVEVVGGRSVAGMDLDVRHAVVIFFVT